MIIGRLFYKNPRRSDALCSHWVTPRAREHSSLPNREPIQLGWCRVTNNKPWNHGLIHPYACTALQGNPLNGSISYTKDMAEGTRELSLRVNRSIHIILCPSDTEKTNARHISLTNLGSGVIFGIVSSKQKKHQFHPGLKELQNDFAWTFCWAFYETNPRIIEIYNATFSRPCSNPATSSVVFKAQEWRKLYTCPFALRPVGLRMSQRKPPLPWSASYWQPEWVWSEWLDLSYPNRRNYNEVPGWAGE